MPALSLSRISKHFGAVQALDQVDFALAEGSIHALLGENGAGKSTLMHIAYGMLSADRGEIHVRGTPVQIRSPRHARRLGIGMVHQHFTLVEAMTVRENVELVRGNRERGTGNREQGAGSRVSSLSAVSSHLSPLTSYHSPLTSHHLDPDAVVESLSVSQKQRLEITKALASGARILLLDEPTAVLAPPEIEELLAGLRRFAADGGSVVLITHKLREALACADRVTVLRQGRVTLDGPVAGRTEAELAEAMVGAQGTGSREQGTGSRMAAAKAVPSHLSPLTSHHSPLTSHPSPIRVSPGEILGVAAVEGNGHRELMRALAAEPSVAFIPEDRGLEGLIGEFTVTENVVLGLGGRAPWVRGGLVDWNAARTRTAALMAEFDVRGAGPEAPAATLSGGNQQRLVLARAFEERPRVLVAENPTRGLDIRATEVVHRRLRQAAAGGVAVVVWSSDLDEVLELADRVVVVRAGEVIPVPAGTGRMAVGRMMLGVEKGEVRSEKGEVGSEKGEEGARVSSEQ
jgi:simple sugar transport system ATP-binding protein